MKWLPVMAVLSLSLAAEAQDAQPRQKAEKRLKSDKPRRSDADETVAAISSAVVIGMMTGSWTSRNATMSLTSTQCCLTAITSGRQLCGRWRAMANDRVMLYIGKEITIYNIVEHNYYYMKWSDAETGAVVEWRRE